jgi:hypothetical protein
MGDEALSEPLSQRDEVVEQRGDLAAVVDVITEGADVELFTPSARRRWTRSWSLIPRIFRRFQRTKLQQ